MARRAILVLAILVWGGSARGGTVETLDLRGLLDRASDVSVVVVESISSRWEDGRIVTYASALIERSVVGLAAGTRITLRALGGEVDGIGQRVFGEPAYRRGERYLAFLERVGGRDSFRAVGMAQGALPVVDGPSGPQVLRNPGVGALVRLECSASLPAWLDGPVDLEEAIRLIRAEVERGR